MQKILGKMRKAIQEYEMIKENDHIAVGVSGGKDSLVLLSALSYYQKFFETKFKLSAVTIDMGFPGTVENEIEETKRYIEKLGIDYYIEKTNIASIIFDERKEKSPCSLCSKMRRGALNTKAIEIGAKKLALGHHNDDILETFLLSFIYEGRLSTFQPTGYMDRMGITLIRPFIYVSEEEINLTCNKYKIPLIKNVCPEDKHTKREEMKKMLEEIEKQNQGAKQRMINAIIHPERNNLWPIR